MNDAAVLSRQLERALDLCNRKEATIDRFVKIIDEARDLLLDVEADGVLTGGLRERVRSFNARYP